MTELEIKQAIECMLDKIWRLKIGLSKVDKEKMANDIFNDITQKLGQTPAGVDTEEVILAKQKNEGVWIAEENGYYYFWDGAKYVKGRPYQGIEDSNAVKDLQRNVKKINEVLNVKPAINLEWKLGKLNPGNGQINPGNPWAFTSSLFEIQGANFILDNNGNDYNNEFELYKYPNKDVATGYQKVNLKYEKQTIVNDSQAYRIAVTKGSPYTQEELEQATKLILVREEGENVIDDIQLKLTALETKTNNSLKLYLPEYVYILDNQVLKIPYNSFITSNDFTLRNSGFWWRHQIKNYWKYSGLLQDNSYVDYQLYSKDNLNDLKDEKRLKVHVATQSNVNPTSKKYIMILGDSFIQSGGIIDVFVEKMKSLGCTNLQYVGSHNNPDTGSGNVFEGSGGYRIWDFINNPADLRPEFPTNPFWNPNINKVDFKYYCEKRGVPRLDYIIIHLGINDKLTDSLKGEEGNKEIKDRMITLLNYIHRDFPQCKCIVDGLVIVSPDNNYWNFEWYKEDIENYNQQLETALTLNNNSFYSPLMPLFDSNYAYKYEMETAYEGSDETYKVVKEWLHPSLVGYRMIANAMIPCFIYYCLNNKAK